VLGVPAEDIRLRDGIDERLEAVASPLASLAGDQHVEEEAPTLYPVIAL
jgi:hypothetical protein